ncbi:MAG: 4-hydroxythreonine-4-phosphate dehydrogenase PdxA [Cyanobacteria bacterium]|nr:4-hydroxythreonine-4-phosphate dehydrogenase PdxA [Cyanobacteriota bacterium]
MTQTSSTLPTYCITPGDPRGIGPEIVLKLLQTLSQEHTSFDLAFQLKIIGHFPTIAKTAQALNLPLPSEDPRIEWIDIPGNPESEAGKIAVEALNISTALIHGGQAQALITGPIAKEALYQSGFNYHGHTEILETLANQNYAHSQPYKADMLFLYQQFRMMLLTRHVPLRDVSHTLSINNTVATLNNTIQFLKTYCGIDTPHLCMLGVNPHAAEIDGTEERTILVPAIQQILGQQTVKIAGPLPGDAVFRGFDPLETPLSPPYDAYIAAYHDQGLIPFKLVAGYRAVNVTIGLPFIRTSVSHGTAFDIAGQGIASAESLLQALVCAHQLYQTGLETLTDDFTGDLTDPREQFASAAH